MLQTIARKYKGITTPLLTLWLLCTSALVCAMTIPGVLTPNGATDLQSKQSLTHHHHSSHSSTMTHHFIAGHEMGSESAETGYYCCDDNEQLASNGLKLSDLPMTAVLTIVIWFIIVKVRSKLPLVRINIPPHPSPPIRVLNCSYLK